MEDNTMLWTVIDVFGTIVDFIYDCIFYVLFVITLILEGIKYLTKK